MSKADDVFIRQFIILLVLIVACGVGAGVLGVWIAGAARDASAGSERATLERIAPVGRLKLGEPGQRARAAAEAAASESAATATATAGESAPDSSTGDSSGATGTTVVAAVSTGDTPSDEAKPATTGAVDKAGEAIYKQYCFACHLTGVAEAPKTGDTEAWAPRAATGFDALYKTVIDGKGAMPPRAGFAHLSDEELKAGIRYLLAVANLTAE